MRKVHIFIGNACIGKTTFQIVDESMGGIMGRFVPNEHYSSYQAQIQQLTANKGIANVDDFNFRIVTTAGIELHSVGGIGLTDVVGIGEIIVEVAGIDWKVMEDLKK
ncbi:MAG: hypothetical protein ACPGXL_02435 [Chitinophagales bacterium]